MPPPSTQRTAAAGGALLLATATLAGCAGGDEPRGVRSPAPSTTTSAASRPTTPTPTPAEQRASDLAREGLTAAYTATYALQRAGAGDPAATVRIYKLGTSYRVDVARGGATSLLMSTAEGPVSCQVRGSRRTCLLVAGPGERPPRLFDPGLQRLVTDVLEAVSGGDGLTVEGAGTMAAADGLPSATCFRISGGEVAPGEYCLTDGGVPRRATYGSGTLELTELAKPPASSVFRPPVRPTPLPT